MLNDAPNSGAAAPELTTLSDFSPLSGRFEEFRV